MSDYEVAIIGYGPTGMTLAALEGPLGFSLSGIVAADSLVVAILAYLILHVFNGNLRRDGIQENPPELARIDGPAK